MGNRSALHQLQNRGTAWEFLKFTMSEEADRQLLEITGQMPSARGDRCLRRLLRGEPRIPPLRRTGGAGHRGSLGSELGRVWQTFATPSSSVIFGEEEIDTAFQQAADTINQLASE